MNQKLKAKLLLGTFLISGLFTTIGNISTVNATIGEMESPSATEGVGNDDASTLPFDPTAQTMQIQTRTPLLVLLQQNFNSAIEYGDVDMLYPLLAQFQRLAGEYVPQFDRLGYEQTLLHVAAIAPRATDTLRALFSNTNTFVTNWMRDHINDQDYYGRTPLHWAAAKHDHNAYNFLVSQGANPMILDSRDHVPAEYFDRPVQYEEVFNNHI